MTVAEWAMRGSVIRGVDLDRIHCAPARAAGATTVRVG